MQVDLEAPPSIRVLPTSPRRKQLPSGEKQHDIMSDRRRRPSFTSKEAEDVAAAVRFRLQLESNELPDRFWKSSAQNAEDRSVIVIRSSSLYSTEDPTAISKSRLSRVRDSQSVMRRRKTPRPPALKLHTETLIPPLQVRSASMAVRPTHESFSAPASPNIGSSVTLRRRKTMSSLKHNSLALVDGHKQLKMHEQESKVPPVPPLSAARFLNVPRMEATATEPRSLEPYKAHKAESKQSKTESQNILGNHSNELSALPRVASWERNNSELTRSSNDMVDKDDDDKNTDSMARFDVPNHSPITGSKFDLVRKRSLFRWLQKRSELDDLIELYMDDDQISEKTWKLPGKSRLMTLWSV